MVDRKDVCALTAIFQDLATQFEKWMLCVGQSKRRFQIESGDLYLLSVPLCQKVLRVPFLNSSGKIVRTDLKRDSTRTP